MQKRCTVSGAALSLYIAIWIYGLAPMVLCHGAARAIVTEWRRLRQQASRAQRVERGRNGAQFLFFKPDIISDDDNPTPSIKPADLVA
jgi:hypothetical protein